MKTLSKTEIPSVEVLKRVGKFHSYILPGYYEVFRIGKTLYVIIDGVTKGKYWQYVEKYKHFEGETFQAGFHPFDGTPCLKDS